MLVSLTQDWTDLIRLSKESSKPVIALTGNYRKEPRKKKKTQKFFEVIGYRDRFILSQTWYKSNQRNRLKDNQARRLIMMLSLCEGKSANFDFGAACGNVSTIISGL